MNPTVRLHGVDAARGLALAGMMTVHVLPGPPDPAYELAEGRSAALFAVLAGVSLVLSKATRAQIAVRAALVAIVGLSLGSVPGPIAVILTCYGLLFLLALPFLRLPVLPLALLAAGWAVLSPVLSQWLRANGLAADPQVPAWSDVLHPVDAVQNLLLTGYYPALTWLTYLLAGLAIGRLLLGRSADQAARAGRGLAVAGLSLAVLAWIVSVLAVRSAGGVRGLTALLPPNSFMQGRGDLLLDETFYGTTPPTSYRWLLVDAPHSGSITDLAQTTGSAIVILGLALMIGEWLGSYARPLVAAGAMTLTIYTVHVLLVDAVSGLPADQQPPPGIFLAAQIIVALAAAAAWGAPENRGPLEEVVAVTVRSV